MSTAEQRAERAAYMRAWNAQHRERLAAERRKRYRTDRQYQDERLGRARMMHLRKRGGLDDATIEFIEVLLNDPCAYCGRRLVMRAESRADTAATDHIDAAGDSHWSNLTGACGSCNASKGEHPLLLSMLERRLRKDMRPIAEQIWLIKGRTGIRRRIEF